MRTCRWMVDEPAAGAWNMAVDEAILLSTLERKDHVPTIRLYRWIEPTLSLGYFQSAADIPETFQTTATVRRLSGGGAILHDREWTYSVTFPAGAWPAENFLNLVRDVHDGIAKLIPGLVFANQSTPAPEPFLCFERRSPHDLLFGNHKIVGSAQRSKQGALLQHGSILMHASSKAVHLPGLKNLMPEDVLRNESMAERFAGDWAQRWNWKLEPGMLSADEIALAQRLEREKYAHSSWTKKR